jgi:hypothetical protein
MSRGHQGHALTMPMSKNRRRYMNRHTLFFVALLTLAGCGTTMSTQGRPAAYYAAAASDQPEVSLFAGDSETLSDDAIRTILAYKYEPPASSRIALMPFGREIWSSWSEELSLASEKIQSDVLGKLRTSPKVYDASYLPSILVPEKRTVPHLREAAARYQADLLLVYRSYCRSFEKYRLFGADKSRAYCSVEAVLLDTRTGLVPFTTVTSRAYDVVQSATDTNFQETMLRAQMDATAASMSDVSNQIVRFLGE